MKLWMNMNINFLILADLCWWKSSLGCFMLPWDTCQIRKIAGCACAGNAGNVFPATYFKGNRWLAIPAASRHVHHARAVMHVGIANPPWWRGKFFRHSWRMRNPQFFVSDKRPMVVSIDKIVPKLCWSERKFWKWHLFPIYKTKQTITN